ncbi:MAG: beta-mannosidase [Pararhizobium sp.]
MTAHDLDGVCDLAGEWRLEEVDGDHAAAIRLPGDVHSALQAAGVIPDPYEGRNEYDVRWVAERDWRISRDFRLDDPAPADASWYLDVDGLDTVAEISINGTVVLSAANAFRRYRPKVVHALKSGENRIEILIRSSLAAGAERQARLPFPVPYSTANSPLPNGNMLRKPQCHFGWDWNIALAPLGLYGTIALKRLDLARIEHVTTRQRHDREAQTAELTVEVTFFAEEAGTIPLRIDLDGHVRDIACAMQPGETRVSETLTIQGPRLWWPAGSGDQALYTLTLDTPSERLSRTIGLREIELLTDPDEAGSRFAFRVNGVEIFCRGANWIPADALFSRVTQEGVADLLTSAVEAHMNMIRVWGGGFYEPDWFYDLCDRLGLLVWQDFMFACNLYPSTPDFLCEVEAEVDDQARRLSTHPSIALFCGDNELVGALTWFEESRKDRDRYLVSYDRLNRTIETALKRAVPDALWWPSSPASGPLDFGDAWHKDGSGDMHYWSVWHEGKSFDNYRTVRPRFCSEFGFQSFPSMPVIRTFAGPGDMNIASPVMESHQKNAGGNARIAETMFRYFRFPRDFADFVYLSQIQQGLAIRTAVDAWRSLKPHCMGTIYWQLNDTWPVASWASLDYGGGWKALHHMARRFFQPVNVVLIASPDSSAFSLSAVNDTREPVGLEFELFALSRAGERRRLASGGSSACPTDRAVHLATIEAAAVPAGHLLVWRWHAANGMSGGEHLAPTAYKALDLDPAGSEVAVAAEAEGSSLLTIEAARPAFFVMVEADVPGRFSDNAFDVLPGEPRTVRFTPKASGERPRFRLHDLQSSFGRAEAPHEERDFQ